LTKLESFDPHILPDVQTYKTIIDAKFAQDPSEDAPFAERMLKRMNHKSSTNRQVEPDIVICSSIIHTWLKSGLLQAGEKAEALLQTMEEIGFKPNAISFNTAISAWVKSSDRSAGQRAELLLQKMLELYEAGSLNAKPKQ
jgi:hypothetical protein